MLQARRTRREQNTHVLCFPFTVANLDGQVVWKLGSDPQKIGLGLTTLLEERPPLIDHTIVGSIAIKSNIWPLEPYIIHLHS